MDNLSLYILVLFFCGTINDTFGRRKYQESDRVGLIVGGEVVTIQDYPYQVHLLLRDAIANSYQCGGSILNNKHILTAAHCVDGIVHIRARVGSTKSNSGGQVLHSVTHVMHPQYNPATFDNDIAIVRLLDPIDINDNTTREITLPEANSDVKTGTSIIVSGWGDTSEGGQGSNILMAVSVPVESRSHCNETYAGGITDNMICAGEEEGGKDSCQGDSGGPAVENGIQHGIVSFGSGCARPGIPGVYTRVANYRTFIMSISGS